MKSFRDGFFVVTTILTGASTFLLVLHTAKIYGQPLAWPYCAHILLTVFLWLSAVAQGDHI